MSAVHRAVADPDARQVLIESLAFEVANTECQYYTIDTYSGFQWASALSRKRLIM